MLWGGGVAPSTDFGGRGAAGGGGPCGACADPAADSSVTTEAARAVEIFICRHRNRSCAAGVRGEASLTAVAKWRKSLSRDTRGVDWSRQLWAMRALEDAVHRLPVPRLRA